MNGALLSLLLFESLCVNLGEVHADAGSLACSFTFANDSREPFRIAFVSPSCTCLTARWPEKPVPPGQTARIDVTFNPSGMYGPVSRYLTVWTSGDKAVATLEVRAEVLRSESPQGHPVPGGGATVSAKAVNFGYVPHGTSATRVEHITNVSGRELDLSSSVSGSSRLKVLCGGKLAAGRTADIVMVYTMPEGTDAVGSCRDTLRISGDGVSAVIPVSALCIDRITADASDGPAMWTTPSPVPADKGYILVGNSGKSDLRVIKVECDPGVEAAFRHNIAPGRKTRIKFRTDRKEYSVRLFTNDPSRPCREIRFKQ